MLVGRSLGLQYFHSILFMQSVKVIEGSGIQQSFSNTPFETKLPYVLEVKQLNMA